MVDTVDEIDYEDEIDYDEMYEYYSGKERTPVEPQPVTNLSSANEELASRLHDKIEAGDFKSVELNRAVPVHVDLDHTLEDNGKVELKALENGNWAVSANDYHFETEDLKQATKNFVSQAYLEDTFIESEFLSEKDKNDLIIEEFEKGNGQADGFKIAEKAKLADLDLKRKEEEKTKESEDVQNIAQPEHDVSLPDSSDTALSKLEKLDTDIATIQSTNDELAAINDSLIKGVLVEHGHANYQHDSENSKSYFVKIKDDAGEEREIWGVDLQRAIKESEAENGERIALSSESNETVTIDGDSLKKNHWSVKNEAELASFEAELSESRNNLNKLNDSRLEIEAAALKEQELQDDRNLALSRAVDDRYEQYSNGEIEFEDIRSTKELSEGFEINAAVAHYRIQSRKLENNEITKADFEKDEKANLGRKLEDSLNRARENELEKADNFIEVSDLRTERDGENQIQNFEMGADARAIETLPEDLKSNFEGKERKGRAYYYDKQTDSVAFVDKGNKLQSSRKFDQTSVRTMVRLAENRGWSQLKVRGDESFRKEVYLEAAKRGIEVKGYKPTEAEKEVADKAKQRHGKNQEAADAFLKAKTPEEKKEAAKKHPNLSHAYGVQAALHAMAKQKRLPNNYRDAMMSKINEKLEQDLRDGNRLPNLQVRRNQQRRQDAAATLER